MDEKKIYTITFLRHGESEGNVQHLFQGQLDFPLTANGRRQASVLGKRWKQEGRIFDEVIASPLARAAETARIVAETLGLSVTHDEAWKEWDFGALSARNYIDYNANPENHFYQTPYDRMGGNGESPNEIYARAGYALQNILSRPPGNYLVVAHGAILNRVMFHILGITPHPNDEGPRVRFGNTSFATVTYSPTQHRWTLMAVNDRAHLDKAPTLKSNYDRHEPVYDLTLLRHGQSQGNLEGVWQGQMDYPLTELGLEQARSLAFYWKEQEIQFDYAFASPQSRAYQTGKIVTKALGMPLESNSLWMERDNGNYAGTSRANRSPEPGYVTPYERVGDTGETAWELYARGGKAVQSILQRKPGRYVIFSHGGILNMALYAMLGIVPLANWQGPRFAFSNTAVAHVVYTPSRNQWRILAMNDLAHIQNKEAMEQWQP